jgi:hypothetical protein
MDDRFDSHQFIVRLAKDYQKEYTEALYPYRSSKYRGKDAPFKIVHGILAKRLTKHEDLIQRIRPDKDSKDIFGSLDSASRWRKL